MGGPDFSLCGLILTPLSVFKECFTLYSVMSDELLKRVQLIPSGITISHMTFVIWIVGIPQRALIKYIVEIISNICNVSRNS